MSSFGNAFADTYAIDGLIFKVRTSGWDIRQNVIGWMQDFFKEGFTGTEKDFARLFQFKIFNMSTDKNQAIVRFQVYGSLCNRALDLPAGQLAFLNEAHFKSYAVNDGDPALDKLRDAIYDSEGGQQANLFGASAHTNLQKGDGRGWRIGDRKSDYHFVCYTRTGQRPGIEVRVKDAPVRRMAAESVELSAVHSLKDRNAWLVMLGKLAKLAADRLYADLARKGIEANDHVRGFTDEKSMVVHHEFAVRSTLDENSYRYRGDDYLGIAEG
jgi:hypothetical protein